MVLKGEHYQISEQKKWAKQRWLATQIANFSMSKKGYKPSDFFDLDIDNAPVYHDTKSTEEIAKVMEERAKAINNARYKKVIFNGK